MSSSHDQNACLHERRGLSTTGTAAMSATRRTGRSSAEVTTLSQAARKGPGRRLWARVVAAVCLVCGVAAVPGVTAADSPRPAARAALTVRVVQPQRSALPLRLAANGSIAAWQEASIGTEANGLRLASVRVGVGDSVRRGQVLATFAPDTVRADAAQTAAGVAEAEAALADAAADAQRARELESTGALSAQRINQYLTAERTARARLDARRAAARIQELRLGQTQVLAPDDGVISARSATVGAVLPAGQELFRMIRKGRLEWRAEVPSADLARIRPGMQASVALSSGGGGAGPAASAGAGGTITGRVRIVAPTVDPLTRNGIVYVDLPASSPVRAGMFARGEFQIGAGDGLTLPLGAVLLRDGFSYVMRVGTNARVTETKVTVGRRVGDRIEITGGLDPAARVVAAGGGFLADGDTVRIIDTVAAAVDRPPTGPNIPVSSPK